jgi:3-methyladenine DNA glycosylase AlkD
MTKVDSMIERVGKTQHGFTDIKLAAGEILGGDSPTENLKVARELLESDVHQARMLAVFILGGLAAKSTTSLKILKNHVSEDSDWRVQEILAQAFDRYCAENGYEKSLPVIKEWLGDPNPNLRRAVTEGLRIWTSKPYFKDHPQVAIKLLSALRSDESEYVRKSVGNALRDISRRHKALIQAELQTWDISNKNTRQVHELAGKFL